MLKKIFFKPFLNVISIFIPLFILVPQKSAAKISADNHGYVSQSTYYQPLAMVNDSPITPIDIEKRVNFLRIVNNIPDTISLTEQDKNKILDTLIEERIKRQETERFKIKIDDDRLNNAFKIATKNLNISEKNFSEKLLKVGIDRLYFDAVTHDKLAWEELVQGRYGRDITVSTYEVAQIIEANALTENLSIVYNQIMFPFDGSEQSQEKIQENLNNIGKKLEQGIDFIEVAKDYQSDTITKTQNISDINPEIAKTLLGLQPQQISRPIQIGNMIALVQFIEKQKGNISVISQKMTVKSGRLDVDSEKTEQEKNYVIQELNNNAKLCKNYDDYIEDITVFNNVTLAELPESLREVAKAAKLGETRIVREALNSYYVLTLCDMKKHDYYNDVSPEIRNKTRNQIFAHKLSLKDKEYYRTLKKYAVITLFQ